MIKYNYKPKEGIFFTSDTHFGHTNILKYCDRPFSSTEEMDEEIIKRWNSVVKPDNTVFHLGDFAFGTIAQWETYRNCLNGHIHLILGNHDMHNFSNSRQRLEEMFETVQFQALIEVGNSKIYLNHYPFLTFAGIYRKNPTWQLFGHVHFKKDSKGADASRLNYCLQTQYDVGVDLNNFTPINYFDVKKKIEEQISSESNLTYWVTSDAPNK